MADVPAPGRFVEFLAPAVHEAASIARAMEGRVANRPKTGEASAAKAALTEADTAVQEVILACLQENFPGVCLEAEEQTPRVAAFPPSARARVVIDPIDGTLHSYLEAGGPYACLVGLAVDDRYEAGLVALPREGLFFDGVRGAGARRTTPPADPTPCVAEASGRRVLVSYGMPESVLRGLAAAGFEPVPGCGGAIAVAPLIPGFRAGLRLVPAGMSISVRGRVGLAVSRAAGAVAWGEDGLDFPDDLRSPRRALVVAADPADLPRLHEALGDSC